jgi:cell division protein FtsQ
MPRVKGKAKAAAPPPQARLPDRPGRWRLIWKRQRQMFRQAVAGTALVCALLLAGLAAQSLGEGANLRERLGDAAARFGLRVREVRVIGQQKTPTELLRAALGVRVGDGILGFSVDDARRRLERIDWVKSATVERRLPGLVVVQLVERRPFAVWQLDGRFSLVDRDGNIVTDSDVATFADQVPLIVGPGAPQAAAALMDMLEKQPEILSRLVAAVRVGGRRWNLRMKNGADVLLPEGAEAQALARLAQLQAEHALLDRPLQAVDMRLPDRLVIRPAANAIPTATRKPT